MNTLFHQCYKLFVTAGMVIAVAVSSTQAQAITQGLPGDALLVPFVLYSGQGGIDINTRIYIKCPKNWRLPDGTMATFPVPTNTDNELQDTDGDGAKEGNGDDSTTSVVGLKYHWWFFDAQSRLRMDGEGVCIPDDLDVIDWGWKAAGGNIEGVPGYLVVTTDAPPPALLPLAVLARIL